MPRSSSNNPIWEFFEEDSEQRHAKCKICGSFYSYVSTTNNLKTHLKRKHGFDDTDFTKDFEHVIANLQTKENDTESSLLPKKRKNSSYLWKIFQKIETFTAKCRLCDQNVRFKGTTGNLGVHLKRYHEDALEEIREAAGSNDEVTLESDDESDLLHSEDKYFKEVDGQIRCTLCYMNLSNDDGENPRQHLEDHHPGLLARIIRNEELAEEEEIKDESELYTEVVYLNPDPPPQTKKRLKWSKETTTGNNIRKRKHSTNSDEYIIKAKKPSEIETFTNYMRMLLEKLPPDVCSKVQLEIINLIMTAQFNLPSSM